MELPPLGTLAAAAVLAKPDGYMRVFVNVGPSDSLSQAPYIINAHGVTASYITKLLTVAGCRPAILAAASAFNERELAVYMVSPLANRTLASPKRWWWPKLL